MRCLLDAGSGNPRHDAECDRPRRRSATHPSARGWSGVEGTRRSDGALANQSSARVAPLRLACALLQLVLELLESACSAWPGWAGRWRESEQHLFRRPALVLCRLASPRGDSQVDADTCTHR